MAEQQNGAGGAFSGTESSFEDIAEVTLAVQLDAAAELPCLCGGKRHAGVDCGFRVRRRFCMNQRAGELDQFGLVATGTGQQSAHGNGRIGGFQHS